MATPARDPTFDADVIVVGSGPSGVSATWPMVEAGMRVMLLDGGRQRDPDLLPTGAYHDLRRHDPEQWRKFLGPGLEALRPGPAASPKLEVPGAQTVVDDFNRQRIAGEGFTVVGSLARGGFTNIWGAGVALYDEDDLASFPLSPADLAPSYRRVAGRIGVTGFDADDLATALDREVPSQPVVVMAENASRLYARYRRRRRAIQALGVRMGRSRAAVLTEPLAGRGECTRCDMCLWGCHQRALYNAADELDDLVRHPNLDYRPGALVERVERCQEGYALILAGTGGSLRARHLVLAASTLATTRLVLEMEQDYDAPRPVIGTPMVNFALFLPERLGAAVASREYSLAQLSFLVAGLPGRSADRIYGSLFAASGIPGAAVVDRMPLTRPAAIRLFRHLQSALLLGNCFLPGSYSANRVRLERGAGGATLVVEGGVAGDLGARLESLKGTLGRVFRRLGALIIPSSFSVFDPGEDLRYSGTLPMRASPGPGQTDAQGELFGAPGLFVVDMSAFPAMPAKHHTLTMMAIADRTGRHVAERCAPRTRPAA